MEKERSRLGKKSALCEVVNNGERECPMVCDAVNDKSGCHGDGKIHKGEKYSLFYNIKITSCKLWVPYMIQRVLKLFFAHSN